MHHQQDTPYDPLALPIVRLNASAVSNSALMITLMTNVLSVPRAFETLIDSGSTHCFMDAAYARNQGFTLTPVPPKQLRLFDGSFGGEIHFGVRAPVLFPSGETLSLEFLVTPLDSSCTAVLGYDWLTL